MPYKNPDAKAEWRRRNRWRQVKYKETFDLRHPEPEWKLRKREQAEKDRLARQVEREESKRLRKEEVERRRNDPELIEQRKLKRKALQKRMTENRFARDQDYQRRHYWANREKRILKCREYKAANPDKVAISNFRSGLKSRYNLSVEDYNRILDNQKRSCRICLKKFDVSLGFIDRPEKAKGIKVDHCHGAGHVRALLCGPCNAMVGCAKNSVWIAQRLASCLSREIIFNGNGA